MGFHAPLFFYIMQELFNDDKLKQYAQFNAIELPEFLTQKTSIDTTITKPLKSNPMTKDNILLRKQNTTEQYEELPEQQAETFAIEKNDKNYVETKNQVIDSINKLDVDDNDKDYLIKLAKKESGFNPKVVNRFGYSGLYQFNPGSLKSVNMNMKEYKTDVNKQHEAALKYGEFNLKRLKNFTKHIGTIFNGIKITREGLMAASHLGGAGNVMDYFVSGGKDDFRDANGTPVSSYLKMFAK